MSDADIDQNSTDIYKRIPPVSTPKLKTATKTASFKASSAAFEDNIIKRERMRRAETCKEIAKMRAALPEYTMDDIRMYKLPYHEALMLRLQENGYVSTEAYIRGMFDLNERLRQEAGPQSYFWTRPLLMNSNKELKLLSDALVEAEIQHNKENYRNETEILLRVGINFAFCYVDWFWVAQELILQCIHNSTVHTTTGKHKAISHYVYAKILLERVKDYQKAEEELEITMELSKGKSWSIRDFVPEDIDSSDTLYMNANYLLHMCYMRQARNYLKTDLNKALEFAVLAKKGAVEACYHDGETMALYIKGQCELNLGKTKEAVSTFHKAFYIQSKLKSEKGMCEARMELSKAYLMNGDTRLALKTLLDLKRKAEEFGFQYYLAQALRYLGEYYLTCGEPCKATPLLSDALNIFHSIGNIIEADQVRNLEALSCGLELLPFYVPLVQRTDKRCPDWFENLIKLVKWKDYRAPFWNEKGTGVTGLDILTQNTDVLSWNMSTTEIQHEKSIDSKYSTLDELSSIIQSKEVSIRDKSLSLVEEPLPDDSSMETLVLEHKPK